MSLPDFPLHPEKSSHCKLLRILFQETLETQSPYWNSTWAFKTVFDQIDSFLGECQRVLELCCVSVVDTASSSNEDETGFRLNDRIRKAMDIETSSSSSLDRTRWSAKAEVTREWIQSAFVFVVGGREGGDNDDGVNDDDDDDDGDGKVGMIKEEPVPYVDCEVKIEENPKKRKKYHHHHRHHHHQLQQQQQQQQPNINDVVDYDDTLESYGSYLDYYHESSSSSSSITPSLFKTCFYCGDDVSSSAYSTHFETCDKRNPSSTNSNNNNTCSKCLKCFTRKEYLVKHLKICAGIVRNDPVDFNLFKCPHCSKSYRTRHHYAYHTQFCNDNKPPEKIYKWDEMHVCEKCGKIFGSKEEKIDSKHFCQPEKHYKCPKCEYKCYYATELRNHYSVKHEGKKDFCCDACGKTYSYQSDLSNHVKVHGKKEYACTECGMQFHRKSTRDRHMSIHFNQNLPCEICGKPFANKRYLNRHKVSQHPENGILVTFQCPVCPGAFREKKYLKKHIQEKHPYESQHVQSIPSQQQQQQQQPPPPPPPPLSM